MFIFLLCANILIIQITSNKVIVLKFHELIKEYNKLENYTTLFINNYLEYKIITEIKIGTPPKIIPFFINSNIKICRIRNEKAINNLDFNIYDKYIPSESYTFKNITELLKLEPLNFFYYSLINDTIILYRDNKCNKKIEINNIQLFLENLNYNENNNKSIKDDYNYSYNFGEIGFSFSKSTDNKSNLLMELKDLNIINSLIITIEYISNQEGLIYIGEYPHIYNSNKFKEDIFMTAYAYPIQSSTSQLKLRMNRLYIFDKNNNEYIDFENNIIFLNFGLGIILCTEEYFNKIIELFFNKYINLNICKINIEKKGHNDYHVISCEKNKEFIIEEFPSLFLFKEEFRYIFELDYKDLFEEVNNVYYFQIVYFPFSCSNFEFGKPFLKKYQLSYNQDSNTIHYYNEMLNKENNENNKDNKGNNSENNNNISLYILIIIIMIFLIVVLIIFSFCIYKKFYSKRKLRTNELNDEFDYNTSINDNP